MQAADTPERLDRYEARLRAFPAYMDAWAGIAREGVDVRRDVAASGDGASGRRSSSVCWRSPPRPRRRSRRSRDDADAAQRIADVVRDVVNPAFARYRETLQDYLPHCTETIGLSALPDGDGHLRRADPRVDHAAARPARGARARARAVRGDPGGARGDRRPPRVRERRRRDRGAPGERREHGSLPRGAAGAGARAGRAELGGRPARSSAACRTTTATSGRSRSSASRTRRSASTTRRPRTARGAARTTSTRRTSPGRPLHHIASLTYHEANPGHHFQLSIEQEIPDRPALRRFGGILASSAFAEGWGLYSERLADEMGLYLDDWERLGMLEAQGHARRASGHRHRHPRARMVARAGDRFDGGRSARRTSTRSIEIDRYIAIPGQALSYMIGMIEIERARRAATEREGAAFSLPDFHDRLLALGQLPLPALRRELG